MMSGRLGPERMAPPQAFEAREITIRRDQVAAMLDCERCQVGVAHQWALDVSAELDEHVPMSSAWKHENGAWRFDEASAEPDRNFRWRGRIENLAIGDNPKETCQYNFGHRERLVSLGELLEPGCV